MEPPVTDDCLQKNGQTEEDGQTFTEIIRQQRGKCCTISAGLVNQDSLSRTDTIYVKVEKQDVQPEVLIMRPDEAQAVIWALSGVLWSYLSRTMDSKGDE